MRRFVAALVVCIGLAVPGYASAYIVEPGSQVEQQLLALKTTDGRPMRDADCRPQGRHFAVLGSQLNASLWTCYISDGLSRVYNVIAHVRDTSAGGIDRLTVLNCWDTYSHFSCPSGSKIALPAKRVASSAAASDPPVYQEDAQLVQKQLMALKTTDGIRIRQADCRPITSNWSTGSASYIFGSLWTCYVSDGLSRVYNVNTHVLNSKTPGLDRLTVLNCWTNYSDYYCPPGAKIVFPKTGKGKPTVKVPPPVKSGN
jgi:hypothetical protein